MTLSRRTIYALFAICVLVVAATPLFAAFMVGETLRHNLSVCVKKADAVEIVDAHASGGHEAAKAIWDAKDECQNVDVVGPTLGAVVHSAPVVLNEKNLTAKVVEILAGDKAIGYFVTTQEVTPKRDRDL